MHDLMIMESTFSLIPYILRILLFGTLLPNSRDKLLRESGKIRMKEISVDKYLKNIFWNAL